LQVWQENHWKYLFQACETLLSRARAPARANRGSLCAGEAPPRRAKSISGSVARTTPSWRSRFKSRIKKNAGTLDAFCTELAREPLTGRRAQDSSPGY